MLQFYFLSILLNLMVGLLLVFSDSGEGEESDLDDVINDSFQNRFLAVFDNRNFRLIVGILCVLVGLMKLLSVTQGDVPVVGDLLPALAGIAGGFCVLLAFYQESSSIDITSMPVIESIFIGGKKYIGIFCLVAGILHFIFPKVLLL